MESPIMKRFLSIATNRKIIENELSKDKLEELEKILDDNFNLDNYYIGECECGCFEKVSFWDTLIYGSIRYDIFDKLIEKKYIDMKKEETQNLILSIYAKLLKNSGTENYTGMSDRIHKYTLIIHNLIIKQDERLIVKDIKENNSLIIDALSGNHQERVDEYVELLLPYYIKYNVKIKSIINSNVSKPEISLLKLENNISNIGSSIIELIVFSEPKLVKKIFKFYKEGKLSFDTDIYDIHYYDNNKYILAPIIMTILQKAWIKNPKHIEQIADYIKMLIDIGVDPKAEAYCSDGKKYTLIDYMKNYQWIYPTSPVYNILEKYCIGIEPKELPKEYSSNYNDEDDPYYSIFKQNEYTKDPLKLMNMVQELKKIYEDTTIIPKIYTSDWDNVPYVSDYLNSFT